MGESEVDSQPMPKALISLLAVFFLTISGCASHTVRPESCRRDAETYASAATKNAPFIDHMPINESATAALSTNASHEKDTDTRKPPTRGKIDLRRLAGLLPQSPPTPADVPSSVVLPSTLYMVVGQEYRLEFASIVKGFNQSTAVKIRGLGKDAQLYSDHWEYVPTASGSYTMQISIEDRAGIARESTSRPVIVVDPRSDAPLRHLSIGDSITRAGGYVEFAVTCVLGGEALGTRTYNGGALSTEGRGGWTLENYLSRIGELEGGDSPFLFPRDEEGSRFYGNAAFWQNVTAGTPPGYEYDGFQMVARGWRDEGTFDFDANGYPKSPTRGDILIDPRLALTEQWREYEGSVWQPSSYRDVELSFAKYIQKNRSAFQGGAPTSISIMLGTVDFLSQLTNEGWAQYSSNMRSLITSIRAWNPNVPIILIGSPNGADESMWVGKGISGEEFNQRMMEHSQRLYKYFDTPEDRANRVYVISFLGVVSPQSMADYVHPTLPEGHDEMGSWLSGILAYLISRGQV